MTEIDRLDQQLLDLLNDDARSPTAALARKLGISRSTVQDRIQRLKQRGIIDGFTLRLNANYRERLLTAHVMLQIQPKHTQRVSVALRAIQGVIALHTVSGIYDMIAEIQAETAEGLDRLLDEIGMLTGIEKTTTSIILATKFRR